MSAWPPCHICKLPKHPGNCIPILVHEVGKLRTENAALLEQLLAAKNAPPLVIEAKPEEFDRKTYQRNLMRDKRAKAKAEKAKA